MLLEVVDRALGKSGAPEPLDIGLSAAELSDWLEQSLCFPDLPVPIGELAHWAFALIELGKEPAVLAAVAAVETALLLANSNYEEKQFVEKILAELHIWIDSSKDKHDLKRLGDLWWSLTRNPPATADTPLGTAATMAWYVAGYDPEGWGDPPDQPDKLESWIAEAANNVTAIVDVFSSAQRAVGGDDLLLINSVRIAVKTWRNADSAES
ncbi:MAG: hypothetical protein JNK76_15455 [Planctomycetales bacterium]|nr:hypothetical protein [Planctomycetales bacterium]MBN8626801.1 hypothetical protein [Planctomycetota bacterium]